MRLTPELDATIVRCEVAGIRSGIATVQRLMPEVRPAHIEIAGGLVAFTGVDSPLSQAYAVGIAGPVSASDVNEITDFYEMRGATPRVFVSPIGDATLGQALAHSGYTPCEYENVLASDAFETHASYDDRIAISRDVDAWARASARGFTGCDEIAPGDLTVASIIARSEGVLPLEARDGDVIAATAAMDLRDGCAGFFAGSTLGAFRDGGLHLALIRDRIARARDAGARFMRATARPGSLSERHFVRCGFVTLYTRALWERRRSDTNPEPL